MDYLPPQARRLPIERSPHDIVGAERAYLFSQWREKAVLAFQIAAPGAGKPAAEAFVDALVSAAVFFAPPPQGTLDDYFQP